MILAIDVGNTNTVVGLYTSDSEELADHWRAATEARRTADEWTSLIRSFLSAEGYVLDDIDGVVLGSVVPKVTVALGRMCDRIGVKPLIVNSSVDTGMPLLLDDPREAGADRIANAVAAYATYGGPVVVVDLGTATTFDVVSAEGEYVGGVILPGIEISLDALFDRAAALRWIDVVPTESVIGTSTATAVRSGATHGYAAQVDGVCERIHAEYGPCRVVSTGGWSSVISPLSKSISKSDPWLTLRGLRLIYLRNAS